MARIARLVVPGFPHHVTQRGVRSLDIFPDDDARRHYLHFLSEEATRAGVRFLSWCLMTNHVHFIAIPMETHSLARAFGEAHRRYTRMRNFQEGVRGYLFQGRFNSCALDERHLVAAARYVERNPVKAGMVVQPWDFRWSSARFHVGLEEKDPLVEEATLLGLVTDWKKLLMAEPEQSEGIRRATRTGRPAGDEEFAKKVEAVTQRDPRPGRAGRPRKAK